MGKFLKKAGIVTASVLFVVLPFQVALAQVTTPPPTPPAGVIVPAAVFTPEPVPVLTNPTGPSGGGSGTTNGTTPGGVPTPSTSPTPPATPGGTRTTPQRNPIETPEITPIDIETQEQCEPLDSSMCLRPEDAANSIVPPVVNNQIKISALVFLGALAGAILWLLINYIMNAGRARQDQLRFARQDRLTAGDRKMEEIRLGYQNIIGVISDIFQKITNNKIPDKNDVAAYKKAAVAIELFGSPEAQNAHKKFLSLLSKPTLPSETEYTVAQVDYMNSLKKDLGLN